jgi:hypothetical protein
MSVACRRQIVALLAALTAFVLQPGTIGRAGFDDTFNPDCPAATALPAVTGKVLTFTGGLQCFQPGSRAFGGNVQVPPDQTISQAAAPQQGQTCQDIYYHPVTFSEDTNPSDETATFPILGGVTRGQLLSSTDAQASGFQDAVVTDTKFGSYELTNPNDPNSPLQCVVTNSPFQFYCPTTGQVGTLCLVFVDTPAFTASAPPAAVVAPFFSNVLGSIQASAGTIHSAPATKGVVNTPVCFWIDGISIPQEQDLTLVLPGPIDPSGRQIFFTYFARIQFQGIDWHFNELSGDDSLAPVPAECEGQNQVVAHQYAQISEPRGNPDSSYDVTATEDYSISIVVYWYDSEGAHGPVPVDTGLKPPTLTAGPYAQFVGQVEGVPIGGQ